MAGRKGVTSRARVGREPSSHLCSSPCHSLRSRSQGNPDCGRRTSTVLSCAFREQRDALAVRPSPYCHPDKTFQSPSPSPNSWRDGRISFYCASFLTRPPERAKTRSSPKRAHSDRARSASKEAGHPSHLAFTATPIKSFQSSSSTFPNSWRDGRG